jgi:uncharacterized membrane protein HdeD (DUF308 family)
MDTAATTLSGGLVMRGILAILFGAAAVFWPGLTLVTIVYLFSAFVLVNGILDVVFGVSRMGTVTQIFVNRYLILLLGVLQVGVGVYLLRHPEVSFATLILLIGFTLIVRGVFELVEGVFESSSALHKGIMVVSGIIAAAAGVVTLFQPEKSGVAFVWILGIYALVTGSLFIALASHLSNVAKLAPKR